MANLVFNIAKGRVAELAARVNANDPTNAVLVLVVLATSGLESDATLLDKDTLADVVSGTTNEVANSGYSRKVLDSSSGITITVDDTNDRVDVDCPDQTWSAVAAGDAWSKLLFCYDPDSTGGADSAIIPLTMHDFVVTPDGNDIVTNIATAGFFRAAA
jgi:hypothetical protein